MRVVLLLILSSLVFQAGCSAFGIATRGELEQERAEARARFEQMRDENRILRERFERLSGTLEATESTLTEMEATLRDFEQQAAGEREQIWSQTGDLQVRMATIEDRLGAAASISDSLRTDLQLARRAAEAASTEALTVRQDLDDVSDRADLARSRSEMLLRAWLQQLRDERGRLERQLSALEASLAQWESEVFETTPRLDEPASGEDGSAAGVTGDETARPSVE